MFAELRSAQFRQRSVERSRVGYESCYMWIDRALKYTFLFKDSYLQEYPICTDFYLYEFLNKAISYDYVNHNSIAILVQTTPLPYSIRETIHFVDPFNVKFEYDYKATIQNSISASLGFKIKTKLKYLPLSDINVCVGYSIFQGYENSFEQTQLWSGIRAKYGYSMNGSYNLSDYRNFDSHAVTVQAFAPIFFVTKSLHLDLGISYTFQQIRIWLLCWRDVFLSYNNWNARHVSRQNSQHWTR